MDIWQGKIETPKTYTEMIEMKGMEAFNYDFRSERERERWSVAGRVGRGGQMLNLKGYYIFNKNSQKVS